MLRGLDNWRMSAKTLNLTVVLRAWQLTRQGDRHDFIQMTVQVLLEVRPRLVRGLCMPHQVI
jgi:hypothetical protein